MGIAALAAALVGVSALINKQTEEEKAWIKESETLVQKNKELTESIKDNHTAFESRISGIEKNSELSRRLAKEIEELANIENKSAGQVEDLKIK